MKSEFCAGGWSNCVRKILSFSILNKCYFVVARSCGLVQLYERQKSKPTTISFKLVKEWKNSTAGPGDQVVAVGCFRNQYMYTCSNDGKLVIRDLINDDADDSVKTYIIDGPVSCLLVNTGDDNMRILVAAGGRNNELKLYDLDFASLLRTYYNGVCTVGFLRASGPIRLSSLAPDYRNALRRTHIQHFSAFCESSRVSPVMVAASTGGGSSFLPELLANWILTTTFLTRHLRLKICAGTQFGDLMMYNAEEPFVSRQPETVLHLSQFPINTLQVFHGGKYLLYTDTMSKVGVIDIETNEVVAFYDYLKIGPTVSSRVYTSKFPRVNWKDDSSKFDPVYVLASTVNGDLVIYRLLENGCSERKLSIHDAGIIPSFELADSDAYEALELVFGEESKVSHAELKRPKYGSPHVEFGLFKPETTLRT